MPFRLFSVFMNDIMNTERERLNKDGARLKGNESVECVIFVDHILLVVYNGEELEETNNLVTYAIRES